MANEVKTVTTIDGIEIQVIMAPARCGRGVGLVIPKLLSFEESKAVTDVMAEPRKVGYPKGKAV